MSTLILTHEQADFDAVASLWAAHRLNPSATPVLPRRVNRNVRAFLDVYGEHFSLTEAEELSRRRVERVIAVDTASPASVRGMSAKTPLTVIDHHPADSSPPASGAPAVGATTTLLIEQLADSAIALSAIEATLLLLGVYEDTGSLTYLTTTPRDARAAAFLLEAGARLDIAGEFLHHPLTEEQRALFDQLLSAAETRTINGQAVVIAAIHGRDTDAELSTLVHRLRDALEASAVFMLVGLEGREPRVQLIARSMTEAIDVGAVAAHFEGGGHSRAAAAAIHNRSLDQTRAELLAQLAKHIRPAVTVAEIMSRGVQTLAPNTTIRAAAERIAKYGYEGYPVVADGKVVGLLTRRAVDRAIRHRLEAQPISAIMEAGEIVVAPHHSLEHLQQIMTAHGWGQVPVIEDGAIIGVVTRTDLLKRLAASQRAAAPPRRNLADKLARAISPERMALLRLASEAAAEVGVSLFVVGGFVRDLLLGVASQDFDLVVEGDAIALARKLAARHGGRVTAHAQFGTAKWKLPAGGALPSLDLVSSRTEFYAHPSALPEVEHGNIKLDLHRRDFTINTLALCLDREAFGEVLDFWGGERDLRDGLIRVLHSISFVDDPTRMLRAVRFEQRFGFRIESRTAELMAHALPLLNRVSGDRIRHELEAIFNEGEPERHLARLAEVGVLRHIHPALAADEDLPRRFAALRQYEQARISAASWAAWLAPLSAKSLDEVMARLRFSARLSEDVRQIAAARAAIGGLRPKMRMSEIQAQLGDFRDEAVRVAAALERDSSLRAALAEFLRRWQSLRLSTSGDDLKTLGLPPGPRYREIINRLQHAYLDGEITSEAEEKALLEKLVAERGGKG